MDRKRELDLTYLGIITGLSESNFNKTDSVCGGVATTVLIAYSFATPRNFSDANYAALTSTVKKGFGSNDLPRRKRMSLRLLFYSLRTLF